MIKSPRFWFFFIKLTYFDISYRLYTCDLSCIRKTNFISTRPKGPMSASYTWKLLSEFTHISVPIYSTFTQGVCCFKPIKSCWHGQEVGFVLRSRWKSHENNAIHFFQSLRNNPNLFKMSTSSCPPCQPAIDVEPMTLTRFILAEQKKHPHATGDFTALMNFIQTAVKAVSSAVRKAGIHSL